MLYQGKTLSTAFFSVLLLSKRFSWSQWLSFVLLSVGIALVQTQDAKSSSAPTGGGTTRGSLRPPGRCHALPLSTLAARAGASPLLGVVAVLSAATLSGLAGVYLEVPRACARACMHAGAARPASVRPRSLLPCR